MSASYNPSLVFGHLVMVNKDNAEVINSLIKDFGAYTSISDIMWAEIDNKLREKYPLLDVSYNVDRMSGSLEKAFVVYAKSTYVGLNMREDEEMVDVLPLRMNKMLLPDEDELAMLRSFEKDYQLVEDLGWVITGWIS